MARHMKSQKNKNRGVFQQFLTKYQSSMGLLHVFTLILSLEDSQGMISLS
jgi:hypothetical protein